MAFLHCHNCNWSQNGGYNIIKKAIPKAFDADVIEAIGLSPFRIAYPDKQSLLKLLKVA